MHFSFLNKILQKHKRNLESNKGKNERKFLQYITHIDRYVIINPTFEIQAMLHININSNIIIVLPPLEHNLYSINSSIDFLNLLNRCQ